MFGRAVICRRRMGPCGHYCRPAGQPGGQWPVPKNPKKYHCTCPYTTRRSCSTNGYQRLDTPNKKQCMNIHKKIQYIIFPYRNARLNPNPLWCQDGGWHGSVIAGSRCQAPRSSPIQRETWNKVYENSWNAYKFFIVLFTRSREFGPYWNAKHVVYARTALQKGRKKSKLPYVCASTLS